MNALDTSVDTTGQAQQFVTHGIEAVGVYLRSDRCSPAMINDLHNAGLKVWSVYEKGRPDHDEYFTAQQGTHDGNNALSFANQIGQPEGSQIYAAVDYDPDDSNSNGPTIRGRIADYMRAFQEVIAPGGYEASVYGSGRTCRILISLGLAKTGWLSLSHGFAEFNSFRPHASIIQVAAVSQDFDSDLIGDPGLPGLW
jgi:hypothetical protein